MKTAVCLALLLACAPAARAETVALKPASDLSAPRKLGLRPHALTLETQTPPALKKLPDGLPRLQFAALALGAGAEKTEFLIAVSETPGRDTRVLVDSNANGDLSDDPVPALKKETYRARDGADLFQLNGSATVTARYGGRELPQKLNFTRNDPRDPNFAANRDALLYSLDVARAGEAKFGERTLKIGLLDTLGAGDFAGRRDSPASGVLIFVDANGSGLFDPRGEAFDTGQPFTIGGVTYEARDVSPDGTRLDLVKSEKKVPEIPPTPDLRPGKKAPAFAAKALDGKPVKFPGDFKGRAVLLHFWASWCGDCLAEVPALADAYRKFGNGKGVAFLGVSLDQPNAAPQLKTFLKQNKMPWPQIYDGGFWNAAAAQVYNVTWIPTLVLVDGDTGEVLAADTDLHGKNLAAALEKHRRK